MGNVPNINTSIKRMDNARVSLKLLNTLKLVIRHAKDAQAPAKVSAAHVPTRCIWHKRRFMEMYA
jgi:hypothetical protein